MKKKGRSLFLAVVMTIGLISSASAAGINNYGDIAAAGMSHTLVIKEDGTVWAWGANQSYQLGTAVKESSATPTQVPGISAAIAVAAGYDFSAVLEYDGCVYTWGYGVDATPKKVEGIDSVVSIAAGQTTLLAIRSDGTVWQWAYGETPEPVPHISRAAVVAVGGSHFLALTCGGEVWAWGDNSYGQLGDGGTQVQKNPVRVTGLYNVVDISAGQSHSIAVTYSGEVYAWGGNQYGQLGNGETIDSATPVLVEAMRDAVSVAAGNGYSLAVNKKGVAYAWGYGEYGQMGNDTTPISQSAPAPVKGVNTALYLSGGVSHALLVTSGKSVYVWGRNRSYQVGNDKNSNATTPQKVLEGAATQERYLITSLEGMSRWVKDEAGPLYSSQMVPPLWWDNYTDDTTRAELAHLLVNIYEQVKHTTVSVSKTDKFTDIAGHPLENDLKKAFQLGIMAGVSDTLAAPDNSITRQEAVKMFCIFLSKTNNVTVSDKLQSLTFYKDASEIDKWAAPYVYYAYQNSIMKGGNDGNFSPTANISRQECLLVAARLAEKNDWIK